ncbi:MAG: penicillin-binding protein activator LpoB [Deltaproteobacteria bacterium]|nr:penicillin-binding protein activator LpoB [Deltaproteobacteria bacterium]
MMKRVTNVALTRESLVLGMLFLFCFACTPDFQAEYVDPQSLKLVDDRWAQNDLDNVGKLIEDLNQQVVRNPRKFGDHPTVIFREIENRTNEHIDTEPVKNKLVDALTNANAMVFIDAAARQDISEELEYQRESGYVDPTKSVAKGRQAGARFLLRGSISSIENTSPDGSQKYLTYQVNLKLTNIQEGTILWSKQYAMSKSIQRSSIKF